MVIRKRQTAVIGTALMILWSTVASAGAPRLLALGGDGAYLEDSRGVLRWYGSLVDYDGMATLESGLFSQDGYRRSYGDLRMTGPALGGHLAVGGEQPAVVIGLWLAEAGDVTDPGTLLEDRLATTGTLLVAREFGDLSLGLAWRHGGAHESGAVDVAGQPVATARDVTRDDVGLGARVDLGESAYLDLAGEWRIAEVRTLEPRSDGTSVDSGDLSSSGSWALRARAFVGLGSFGALVPVAEYLREDRPAAFTDLSVLLDGWAGRLGCGYTWLPDPDRLVLVSIDHRWSDSDQSYLAPDYSASTRVETSTWALRAAVELRTGAFWSVRAAAGFEWVDENLTAAGQGPRGSDGTLVPISLGLALHAGPWDLDLGLANHPPAGADGLRPASDMGSTWLSAAATASF